MRLAANQGKGVYYAQPSKENAMRRLANYIEGARSAFTLFPQHEPQRFEIRKRERLTLRDEMERDAQALREDLRKAWGLVREQG